MWDRAQAFIDNGGPQPELVPEVKVVEPEPVAKKEVETTTEKPVEPNKANEIPDDFPKKSDVTPESISTWKGMKDELKALRTERDGLKTSLPEKDKAVQEKMLEIEQMKAKIAEFEGKDISAYERKISEMEAKLGEHEKFRSIHDVRNSPAYEQQILEPAAQIGEALNILAGANDVDVKTLQNVLEISDPIEQRKQLREITDGWHPSDAGELMQHARDTQKLLNLSSEMLDNADETKRELTFMEQEKSRKDKENEEKQITSAAEVANKLLQEKIPFIKDNKELFEAISKAEIKKDPASLAVAARASIILPHLLRQLDERNAKIKELEMSITARSSAAARPTSTQAQASGKDDLPTDFSMESMMERYKRMQMA